MKPLLIAVGVAGLLLGVAGSSEAPQSERVYPIFELTDEELAQIDVKDGSVEDWEEIVGEATFTALDFNTWPKDDPYDPADMDFRVWVAWHDATNRIYVAMERADDVFLNEFNRTATASDLNRYMDGQDSCVELGVDADHSGGQYAGFGAGGQRPNEEQLLRTNQQAQAYLAVAEVYDTGPQVGTPYDSWFGGAEWFRTPPYAEGGGRAFGEQPTISVTEFYVTPFDRFLWNHPEESVISDLYLGKIIGLSISVHDRDAGHLEDPPIRYYLGDWNSGYSGRFIDGLLVGAGGVLPEDTSVEDISWARIKAAFVR